MQIVRMTPRTAIILLFVFFAIFLGAGGVYLADRLYLEPMRQQQRMIANLKTIVEQLTRDVRLAEVVVLEQTPEKTRFKFVEVTEKNEPLGAPKVFEIAGDVAYFDTLVIKFEDAQKFFDDERLKREDATKQLCNKAIILFRRVFGEKQKPEDGFTLDAPDAAPEIYRPPAPPSGLEQQLWRDFWKLANDPALARARGIRAAHGQAVYTKLQTDKYYVLERRITGELTIRPVDLPAVMKPANPSAR